VNLGFGKTKATDIFEAVFDYNGSVANSTPAKVPSRVSVAKQEELKTSDPSSMADKLNSSVSADTNSPVQPKSSSSSDGRIQGPSEPIKVEEVKVQVDE